MTVHVAFTNPNLSRITEMFMQISWLNKPVDHEGRQRDKQNDLRTDGRTDGRIQPIVGSFWTCHVYSSVMVYNCSTWNPLLLSDRLQISDFVEYCFLDSAHLLT